MKLSEEVPQRTQVVQMSSPQTFLENLEWRRAVKHFGSGEVDVDPIVKAMVNE